MGHAPPPPAPTPISECSEATLRSAIDLFRFSRHAHLRRRSYDACLELIRRAEIECGFVKAPRPWQSRVLAPPPPPKPARPTYSVGNTRRF